MKEEYIKILLDFAEGRTTAEQFLEVWKTNENLRELIINCPNRPDESGIDFNPVVLHTKNLKIDSYRDSSGLYTMAKKYLLRNKIEFKPNAFYNNRYDFLLKMQPDWLDLDYNNEKFLIDLANSAPKGLSEEQKIKWCREKLKEYFKYDNSPPRWIQSPEWPIINGKPLVFKGQSGDRKESELVKFFFYDPKTGEETVVEQYY